MHFIRRRKDSRQRNQPRWGDRRVDFTPALPLWESVGMRCGFAPHFRHLYDLFAPPKKKKNWPCLLIRLEGPDDPTSETPDFGGHVTPLTLQYLWPRPGRAWLQAGAQRVVIVVLPPLNSLRIDSRFDFIQILLGPISKPPIFSMQTIFLPPKIDQIYHFIQILLGPILNFERRTPTDFYPECLPRDFTPTRVSVEYQISQIWPKQSGLIE